MIIIIYLAPLSTIKYLHSKIHIYHYLALVLTEAFSRRPLDCPRPSSSDIIVGNRGDPNTH